MTRCEIAKPMRKCAESEAIVQRETIHEDDIGGKATMGVGNKMQSVREREKKNIQMLYEEWWYPCLF